MRRVVEVVFGMILCVTGVFAMVFAGLCSSMGGLPNGKLQLAGIFFIGLVFFGIGILIGRPHKKPIEPKNPQRRKDSL